MLVIVKRQTLDFNFQSNKFKSTQIHLYILLNVYTKLHRLNIAIPIGGPYEAFGGRDASRALARFEVVAATDKYDDLSDLNTTEMNSIKEWEEQFKGKQISAY